jgi:Zn-dependent protease
MVRWGTVIFASLLLHELWRALWGLLRGRRATLILSVLGASTRFHPRLPHFEAIGASLVGPVISVAMGLGFSYAPRPIACAEWLAFASSFNLAWGVINLLPILPFDGGRVLEIVLGGRREWVTMVVTIMTAEVAAALAVVLLKSPELALLMLAAGVSSGWRFARSHERRLQARAEKRLSTADFLLVSRSYPEAWHAAKDAAMSACTTELRNAALTSLAWAALGEGETERAREVLRHVLPVDAVDPYTLAAVESASGNVDCAIEALDRARDTRRLGRNAVRLLVDLHASRGNYVQVAAIAYEFSGPLGRKDVRRVVRALEDAGRPELAASLAAAVRRPPRSRPRLPGEPPPLSTPALRK